MALMWLVQNDNIVWRCKPCAIPKSCELRVAAPLLYGSCFMSRDENDFRIRPGRSRDSGKGSGRKAQRLAAQVKRAASRAGYSRNAKGGWSSAGGTGNQGRGRRALAAMRSQSGQRRVTVMARIVRHTGAHFRSAPMSLHISYLERDGVTRDGRDASMFDATGDNADREAFALGCEDDRHHFRFIVSPEDAGQMENLPTFTRELMADMARDLGSKLEWVAVDHWNTDNPHIHILVRGVADDGTDLVIDRGYVSKGVRHRAEERVTLELGPRSEQEIHKALEREVGAERWTGLDRQLAEAQQDGSGFIDLRAGPGGDTEMNRLLRGRAARLETLGLATLQSPGVWTVEADAENTLRALSVRNDIIKTVHRAMAQDRRFDPAALALHDDGGGASVVGRLVERGLHDELAGSAYAIIDGADGHIHHLRLGTLEMTGDAPPGAIVELRSWQDNKGDTRLSLSTRSDLALSEQVTAQGATWLDRQLVARDAVATANGFGVEIRNAMQKRAAFLEAEGLATSRGGRFTFARDLIETLKTREIEMAAGQLAARTGLVHRPSAKGEQVEGVYRQRLSLASGRFAMIDDGLGFQLVPWRPALDRHLGQSVSGTLSLTGSVEWNLGRSKGIGL